MSVFTGSVQLAKLLFKQTVETDMALSALLSYLDIDPDYLRKLRAESVKSVKATNGQLAEYPDYGYRLRF